MKTDVPVWRRVADELDRIQASGTPARAIVVPRTASMHTLASAGWYGANATAEEQESAAAYLDGEPILIIGSEAFVALISAGPPGQPQAAVDPDTGALCFLGVPIIEQPAERGGE